MKTRSKKAIALALSLAMALALSACSGFPGFSGKSKAPEAADLAARIAETDLSGYYDVSMAMYGAVEDGDGAGRITLEADVESDGTVTHIKDMSMGFGMEGMALELSAEAWTDQLSRKAYMDMRVLGQDTGWVVSGLDDADISMIGMDSTVGSLSGVAPDEGSDARVLDHEPGSSWVLEWSIDPSSLDGLMDSMADADTAGMGDRIQSLTAQAAFSEQDHVLESISIRGSGDGADLSIAMAFHAIGGGTKLSVPKEVIDAAVEGGADDGFGGYGGDDGYGSDSDGDYDDNGSDWLKMSSDGYMTDGDGYDELIDGMAKAAAAKCGDGESVTVLHYSDYAEMTVRHDGDDWSGEIGVRNVTDDSYGGARYYFDSEKEFLSGWYSDDGPVEESDTMFLYMKNDNELDLGEIDGNVTVSASAYTYEASSLETLKGYAYYLKSLAGIE